MLNKHVMSKYAAVASAVALACTAGASYAGSIAAGTLIKMGSAANAASASTEDFVPNGSIGAGNTLSVTLNASYAANDTVVVTMSVGSFRTTG